MSMFIDLTYCKYLSIQRVRAYLQGSPLTTLQADYNVAVQIRSPRDRRVETEVH